MPVQGVEIATIFDGRIYDCIWQSNVPQCTVIALETTCEIDQRRFKKNLFTAEVFAFHLRLLLGVKIEDKEETLHVKEPWY